MPLIGIDLGTTHSLASVFKDGQARLIPNSLGEYLTPSVVGIDGDGSILVGRAARDRLVTHPDLGQAAFKRYMGGRKSFQLGKRAFLPEELSSFVLRSLKADAEAFLGTPVEEAVISVPAYFNDAQRKATRAAGQLAGLKVERLVNEPTAAAVAYGLPNVDKEATFLVFDLGGGTFDVSILELFDGTMEVHAASGDNFLGGEDFDQALADAFLAAHKLEPAKLDPRTLARLKRKAEQAKISLGAGKSAALSLEVEGRTLEWSVDRDGFEALCKPLLLRLRGPVERALRDARLKPSDLDSIILVGGSTRLPFVRALVARMLGRIPSTHLDPDQVVGLGAGIMAAMKARQEDLREVVMTDVCPYSLGVGIAREVGGGGWQAGHFLPVIERNSTVPVSRSQVVTPTQEGQKEIVVEVYQGESRLVQNNVALGRLAVPLPKGSREEQAVEIRFTYDINGLLEVEATVLKTSEKTSLVIEENPGVLSKEEIEKRLRELADLKIHPRDQMENRALLARAERLFEEHLGPVRDRLGEEIARFTHLVELQDPKAIEEARAQLAARLLALEREGSLP